MSGETNCIYLLQISSEERHFELAERTAIGIRDVVTKTHRNLGGPPHWPLLSVNWTPDITRKMNTYKVNFNTIEKASEHLRVFFKCSQALPLPFRKSDFAHSSVFTMGRIKSKIRPRRNMFHPREYINEIGPHGRSVADTVVIFLKFLDRVIMF